MRALASHLTGILAVSVLAPFALLLTSCTTEAAQLSVTLSSSFGASYTPGTTDADFEITVHNLGPGNASGVVIHAVMPPGFQYAATNFINSGSAARTTPEDAQVGGANPQWGVWSLSSPTSPNGTADYASVTINFAVNIVAAAEHVLARRRGDRRQPHRHGAEPSHSGCRQRSTAAGN